MLADYPKVLQMLENVNTNSVRQAQAELTGLVQENIQMIACLHTALRDKLVSLEIKTLAASFINKILTNNRVEFRQHILYGFLSKLFIDEEIQIRYKRLLLRGLTAVLQIHDDKYLLLWKDLTFEMIQRTNDYQTAFLIISGMAAAQVEITVIAKVIQALFQKSFRIFQFVPNSIDQWIRTECMINTWKMVIDLLSHNDQGDQLFKMANNQIFCRGLYSIYQAYTSSGHYYCSKESLQILNPQQYIHEINQMKENAAQMHLKLLNHSSKSKVETKLLEYTGLNIERLVNSLFLGGLSPQFINENECDTFQLHLLQILKQLFAIIPQTFTSIWKNLIHQIIVPFLKISYAQLEQFEDNPGGYTQLFQDCCQQQVIQNLKSQSAQLLQKVAEIIPKFTQQNISEYILQFAIDSIKHYLNMQVFNSPDSNFKPMSLDVAFLVLSIMSCGIAQHSYVINELKIVLCDQKVFKLPPLQLSHVLMFLSYNYSDIFRAYNSGIHWVQFALNNFQHPTVQHCALDFIFNAITVVYNDTILSKLVQRISHCNSANLWQIIRKTINTHLNKIPDQILIRLIMLSLSRLQSQFTILQTAQIKRTSNVINIIQIFRTIMGHTQRIKSRPQIKNKIWLITQYYRKAVIFNFEDQMIQLINYFLNYATKEEICDSQLFQFLHELTVQFKLESMPQSYFFVAFNNYVMKGQFVKVVYPVYKVLVNGLQNATKLSMHPSLLRQKIVIAHHMIVLQNLVSYHGSNLSTQDCHYLYQLLKSYYPKQQYNYQTKQVTYPEIFDKCLLGRSLNLQFLLILSQSSKNKQISISSDFLKSLQKYHNLKIYYGYDMKILLLCIMQQIYKQQNMTTIRDLMVILVQSMFYYLQKLKLEKDLAVKYKQENLRNPSTKIVLSKTNNYQALLSKIQSAFGLVSTKNLRQAFRDFMFELQKKNGMLFEGIIKSMDLFVQQSLKKIIGKNYQNFINKVLGQTNTIKQEPNVKEGNVVINRKIFAILKSKNDTASDNNANQEPEESLQEFAENKQKLQSYKRVRPQMQQEQQDNNQMQFELDGGNLLKKNQVIRKRRKKFT